MRAHLVDGLLPLWALHGLDHTHGGCWNRLGPGGAPLPDGYKRLLVHARQLYAFTRGAELGAAAWARDAAEHAREFLVHHFWDARHGGWFATTDDGGAPLDRRKDLYDHAFAIFALAHHARATGAAESLRLARETLALVRARLADPRAGGFFERASEEWQPLGGSRRQNPHMHLFEALLALHDAAPDACALADARRLLELLERRWLDPASAALREHFDAAWQPLVGDAGERVEPGHHFEWVWLLDRFAALEPGSAAAGLGARLFAFAERHGVDADGGVFDQVALDGRLRLATKRLWPQTERVKALASREPRLRAELEQALGRCFARYADPASGGWREQLDRDGRVMSDAQNATSVYHVVFALCEAREALRALAR